jgi:acetylglutamate kinase
VRFAQDVGKLMREGRRVVIVHGGGPMISGMLKRLNIESVFKDGLRVTDAATMQVVEMMLSGTVNKQVVSLFEQNGARAVGFSGKDGSCLKAEQISVDYGLVGEVTAVDPTLFKLVLDAGYVPVIAPVAVSAEGSALNVNADTAAGAVAGALKAHCFVLVTDVPGVLDAKGELIVGLTRAETESLIAEGVISGGMIPKVNSCLEAMDRGVSRSMIVDGRKPGNLAACLLNQGGSGTTFS